ncbi:MAG: alpha/beta hydrolase [Thermoplasmata archaeon]|nr:alpha/beta hydrolase [Thermoplasmata archaeon]
MMATHPTEGSSPAVHLLRTESGTIGYETFGPAGPLIVCSPGMGDLRRIYRFVAPALAAAGYRVVVTDVRGMGPGTSHWVDYSEAAIGRDLVNLVREVGGGPAILVANSISAGAAVCAAAASPETVSGLVLLAPFVRDVPVSFGMKMVFRLALMRPWGPSTWAKYQATKLYASTPPADLPTHTAQVLANLREPGRMVGFQKMARTNHASAAASLAKVRSPTLVVIGAADPDYPSPREEGRWVADRLHGELVVLDRVGHYPQAEAPDRLLPVLLPFLAKVRPAA